MILSPSIKSSHHLSRKSSIYSLQSTMKKNTTPKTLLKTTNYSFHHHLIFFYFFLSLSLVSTTEINIRDPPSYKDPNVPIEERVSDLLSRMTLPEKIGQMTQIDRTVASPDVVKDFFIGSVLNGGGSSPLPNTTPSMWADMVDSYQKSAMEIRLGIPYIYGTDAVHGHNNAFGATVFPHNIGLGAARDEDLMIRIGRATALEVQATGIPYAFAPCIADLNPGLCYQRTTDFTNSTELIFATLIIITLADVNSFELVCRDPRWGRCYESYSEDTDTVRRMSKIILGLQGFPPLNHTKGYPFVAGGKLARNRVVGCAKHYAGDGGTEGGINENNTVASFSDLYRIHIRPYEDALAMGVSTVMVSYSSWNGVKMHANPFLLTHLLKNHLGFQGFLISDWEGLDRITSPPGSNYKNSVKAAINAGIDMVMVPYNYQSFITDLTDHVMSGQVPMSRIDDAVRRILRIKFIAGLFERPYADRSLLNLVGREKHRELAREAVRKSLVLLKNGIEKPMLPLSKTVDRILVAGSHANDIGNQCGGWTINWEGSPGNITLGTTVLQGIENAVSSRTQVVFKEKPDDQFLNNSNFSYAIVVVGEPPYVESSGDNNELTLQPDGIETITNVCGKTKCLVIIISGRPVVIEPYLDKMEALVAAWLPGSEAGKGIADVIFGDFDFQGKLPRTWFRSVDQLPMNYGDPNYDPLFPFGFGLDMDLASLRKRHHKLYLSSFI